MLVNHFGMFSTIDVQLMVLTRPLIIQCKNTCFIGYCFRDLLLTISFASFRKNFNKD